MSTEIAKLLVEAGIAEDIKSAEIIEINLGDKMRSALQKLIGGQQTSKEPTKPKPIPLKIVPYRPRTESVEPVGGSPYREYKPPKGPKEPTQPKEGMDEFKKRWGIKKS